MADQNAFRREVLYCPLFVRLPCFLSNLGPFISWDVFLHPAQNSPVLVHPGVFSLYFLPSVQPWIHVDTLLPALFVVLSPRGFLLGCFDLAVSV